MTFTRPALAWVAVLAIATGAAGLRFADLADRPMHADEAILADKFGTLLEKGSYRYDPANYHGPALLYLTLAPARLGGFRTYADLNETMLRLVPALAGFALVLLPLGIADGIGRRAAVMASLLTAISPAMVFYSRYYIPEILLALFGFGVIVCGWRYAQSRRALWAVLCGISAGLAYATKETSVIAFAAMGIAFFVTRPWPAKPAHVVLAACAALATALVLFSPAGLFDSCRSLGAYVGRAVHDPLHRHPPYYYLQVAAGEALVLILCVPGVLAARKPLTRFLAVYALVMAACYAVIPYKTPWCLLQFWQPLIVVAGVGAAALLQAPRLRMAVAVLLAAGCLHLTWQAWAATHRYACDPQNPYVYAHTGRDVYAIRDRLGAVADLPIQIFSTENLWPLPWYLRSFKRVEWWREVPATAKAAPVILASAEMEPALTRKLYELPPPGEREMYLHLFDRRIELRPGVEVRGYVANRVRGAGP